jgi:3-polyprenyl-4-hydroxybenzoate decarboxylase
MDEMALHFAARICDLLGVAVPAGSIKRWQGF